LICGIVSLTDLLSNNNASQSILDTAQIAHSLMSTKPLYVDIPPHLDSDFDKRFDEVFFQI
jgi:hypothetical protein